MTRTLGTYFGKRFIVMLAAIFGGVFGLVLLVDYLEMMRRFGHIPNASVVTIALASFYRVPQLLERILPFAVLIGAMSSFLALSRRLEFVIARSAGMSAWQFTAPAVVVALAVGLFATAAYNPLAAVMHEQSKWMEAQLSGNAPQHRGSTSSGIWLRQRGADGNSIVNAASSREQGIQLGNVTVFAFDHGNRFVERIEAASARLEEGRWRLENARVYSPGNPPVERATYLLSTNLTAEQVQESFSTPETVPFWELPEYIARAENAGLSASAYRLQYQKLLSRPVLLAGMVFLAAAFSLRFFRFGGVQKMVLGGVVSGFAFYVVTKLGDDLSKAELVNPLVAAWSPALLTGLAGIVALLFLEDG
jgi:lipopolysaccharide export system permease protein